MDNRLRSGWLLKIVLEVVLISIGVFLALRAEQWRERARDRELAEASLRGFRSEILRNRKAVEGVKDYHAALFKELRAYFAADPKKRTADNIQIRGLQPVFFEQTAWDLALATQALAPLQENFEGLVSYYGDIVLWEPQLLQMYDELVPQIDRALGDSR